MTTMIDRNAAFAAERTNQAAAAVAARDAAIAANSTRVADFDARVADGRLAALGNGRFRVTDPNSWDNGEVLMLRQTAIGPLVVPEHNLDESTGKVALYSRTPAWHQLGTIVPEGLTDIAAILDAGGVAFKVVCRPVLYEPTMGAGARPFEGRYVTVREDTGVGLGVVGKVYTPIQQLDGFAFVADLLDLDGEDAALAVESIGALYGGRKVFLTMRLPRDITIDPEGIADRIVPYIAAINSHDGMSQFEVVATPWRIECGNTERFAVRDAITRWATSHTNGATQRINDARRTLKLSNAYYEAFAREETTLAQAELTMDEFRTLVDAVWADRVAEPTDGARKVGNYLRRHEALVELFTSYGDRLGRTAYAAERAVTEFSDWKRDLKPRGILKEFSPAAVRATSALDGLDDDRKSTAHRTLMAMVNARR